MRYHRHAIINKRIDCVLAFTSLYPVTPTELRLAPISTSSVPSAARGATTSSNSQTSAISVGATRYGAALGAC